MKSIAHDALRSQFFSRRRMLATGLGAVGGGLLAAAGSQPSPLPPPPSASKAKSSPFQINLGDYAKGDGSDETDAIQEAINVIPSSRAEHFGAELYIPRPPKFYGISKTILIEEKWNCVIRCATPAVIERIVDIGHDHYFQWLGADGGIMFRVDACKGLHLFNLSLNGRDKSFTRADRSYIGTTQGVTGMVFGPVKAAMGFATDIVVDSLCMTNVHDGLVLGEFANNGPDVRTIYFNHLAIFNFAHRGVVMQSGNLCTITLMNPSIHSARTDGKKALACIEGFSGEMLVLNYNSFGMLEADILMHCTGIHVVKAWSEVFAPFLKTDSVKVDLSPGAPYYGILNYPIILEGCRHYNGWPSFAKEVSRSVIYDLPVPLHLIGCTFYRGVELGEVSGGCILEQGTLFIDPTAGFTGPGITRHHRIVSMGSRDPKNSRIMQPYWVDRRNTPGIESPKTGLWERGDGIINVEPDPTVPAKACRGWVCIESGEPGQWKPYGAIGV